MRELFAKLTLTLYLIQKNEFLYVVKRLPGKKRFRYCFF